MTNNTPQDWNTIQYPALNDNSKRIYTVSSPMTGIKRRDICVFQSAEDLQNYFENLHEGDLQFVQDSRGNVKVVGVGQGKNITTKIKSFGEKFKNPGNYVSGPIECLNMVIDYYK